MTTSMQTANVGATFEGRVREMSLDRILAFSGGFFDEPNWPHKNLHTDLAKAQEAGLPDLIASGNHSVGILVELLVQLFGEIWLCHGELDLKVVNSVYAGDTVQAKAVVKERQETDNGTTVTLDAWCENQTGTLVIVGTAMCPMHAG